MPWYWTDEIYETLDRHDRLGKDGVERPNAMPIGIRRAEITLEEAAMALEEDGEIPPAA